MDSLTQPFSYVHSRVASKRHEMPPPLKPPNANYKNSNFTISNPNFRTSFSYKNKIFWFPQHQSKALQALKKGIHHIDLLVEVRDARIPLTFVKNQDLDFNRQVGFIVGFV